MKTVTLHLQPEDYKTLLEIARKQDHTTVEAMVGRWLEDIAEDERQFPK